MKNQVLKMQLAALSALFSVTAVAQVNTSRPKIVPASKFKLESVVNSVSAQDAAAVKASASSVKADASVAKKFKDSRGGYNGGGGGNIIRSTPKEVLQYLQTVRRYGDDKSPGMIGFVWDLFDQMMEMQRVQGKTSFLHVPSRTQNLISKLDLSLFNSLVGDKNPANAVVNKDMTYNLADFGIDLKMEGACLHQGEPRDASYDANTNRICLSVERLQAYTQPQMKSVVVPLYFHELTHKAGFGEDEAKEVQNFLYDRLTRQKCKIEISEGMERDASGNFPQARVDMTRTRVSIPNSNRIEFETEDWGLRDKLGGFYAFNSTRWMLQTYPDKTGQVTVADGSFGPPKGHFNLKWNSNLTGEMTFDAADQSTPPKVVTNRIVWSRPEPATGPSAMYGGYDAKALPGTVMTVKGKVFKIGSESDVKFRLKFTGSCF